MAAGTPGLGLFSCGDRLLALAWLRQGEKVCYYGRQLDKQTLVEEESFGGLVDADVFEGALSALRSASGDPGEAVEALRAASERLPEGTMKLFDAVFTLGEEVGLTSAIP